MTIRPLGQVLKHFRGLSGLSQKAAAEGAGITPGALSHIELGKRLPSLPVLWRLCAAIGVRASRVLHHTESYQRLPDEIP